MCPLCCKNSCCASRCCTGGRGAGGSRPKEFARRGNEANTSPGAHSEAPGLSSGAGHQQHPKPENRDSQHKLKQPRVVIFFSLTEAPLPDPTPTHPTPRNGPEADPKQTRNGAKRSRTEPKRTEAEPKWTEIEPSGVGRPGGFVGVGKGGIGVVREKENHEKCPKICVFSFPGQFLDIFRTFLGHFVDIPFFWAVQRFARYKPRGLFPPEFFCGFQSHTNMGRPKNKVF